MQIGIINGMIDIVCGEIDTAYGKISFTTPSILKWKISKITLNLEFDFLVD